MFYIGTFFISAPDPTIIMKKLQNSIDKSSLHN